MNREQLAQLALGVALTAVAGYVDAIGFLTLKHLFVSFMSGNSTQLAVSAAQGSRSNAWLAAALVVCFVAGVSLAHLFHTWTQGWHRPVTLGTEAVLLTLGSLLPVRPMILAVPIALAMGMQNSVLHKVGETKTNLTYVTGTLVNVGEKLVDAFKASDTAGRWAWAPYLLLWTGLVSGAAGGAYAYQGLQIRALLIAVAVLLGLSVITAQAAIASRSRSA